MNLWYFISNIYQTALHIAIEKENIEIIQLLLSHPDIDINCKCIL